MSKLHCMNSLHWTYLSSNTFVKLTAQKLSDRGDVQSLILQKQFSDFHKSDFSTSLLIAPLAEMFENTTN